MKELIDCLPKCIPEREFIASKVSKFLDEMYGKDSSVIRNAILLLIGRTLDSLVFYEKKDAEEFLINLEENLKIWKEKLLDMNSGEN